jgi:hypothetical protein
MNATKFEPIDKEKIDGLRFPATEVLMEKDKIAERDENLKRALVLGNREHGKARIYFEDDTSQKVVETTVWGVTDKRIILKHGVVIPIHRVHQIKF